MYSLNISGAQTLPLPVTVSNGNVSSLSLVTVETHFQNIAIPYRKIAKIGPKI
jgi:hypothetical protein